MKATFHGGVHPAHSSKHATSSLPVRDFVSDTVQLVMNMNIGAPSAPCVKKGDHVLMGQVIGEPVGPLGVPVHASVSGEVVSVEPLPYLGEVPPMCVTIRNDFQDEWVELNPLGSVEKVDPALIIPAIKAAGITGMGGASFPTHVKLSLRPDQKCDYIIANGAECETHLTCDHRLMLEHSVRVVDGLRAAMRALNVKEGIIAIEDNKPDAIEAMTAAAKDRTGVRVQVLKTKYPQGGEKQLIEAVTGRQVPSGGLPIQCGCVVLNVATCAAIADAVIDGRPLVTRLCTVTGHVRQPANLRLRIGTITNDIIGECGGYEDEPGKIFFGGAMTGLCLPNDTMPTSKSTGGIVVFSKAEARSMEEGPCIRCGKCSEVCPMGLNPYMIKAAADADDLEKAKKLNVMDCTVCGSCSFICPARRWLTASFKIAKSNIMQQAKKAKEAAAK
ncbi:MAG: electron transport complex subunit RsxC [Clostridia bacterium]|nr:electron transport complex subunit RsxC [Clostridia bacterium]